MNDGLTHCMHYFYSLPNGWITIQEAEGCHGGSYVVPVANRKFFPKYQIDYIKHSLGKLPVTKVAIAEQVSPHKLCIKLDDFKLECTQTERKYQSYVGKKLAHPDFLFEFAEVDFEPGVLDAMFNATQYILVGCSPFRYREVDDKGLIL